ncbi:hypothetical protein [Arthrobacter sp. PAMC25284]|jgi:hypothetical protein|uniref:hypothetical protein n=1 Tax=Arthrobacter sp. PAMC25284 TaxID=2861279 RepID=UPI001C63AF7D|nr:hypothetical protein [Arthrobacter sp. PAMC25284]QYF88561.1 hypothetical protein KY499_09780 [Arthrobacter sp. PAMC25284]
MKRVNARIATVLGDQRVAINIGADIGVSVDDQVIIFDVIEIPDPDNPGEVLGETELPVLTMKIESVSDRFSVARVPFKMPNIGQIVSGIRAEPEVLITKDASMKERSGWVVVEPGETVQVQLTGQD